ncbi:response regulator [Paenibacillus pasadenensis]|uniref:response regulator n=1 Tax=Paenibacillus TaxID=44249 RepID=UPI00042215CF|nr:MULTISPECIES: response regulator [Paenibacillus]
MRIQSKISSLVVVLTLTYFIGLAWIQADPVLTAVSTAVAAAGIAASAWHSRSLGRRMRAGLAETAGIAERIERGEPVASAAADAPADELGAIAGSFRQIARSLHVKTEQERTLRLQAEEEAWLNARVSEMAILLQGSIEVGAASRIFLAKLASSVDASCGALYALRPDGAYHAAAGYAHDEAELPSEPVRLGQGLVGQCAENRAMIELAEVPPGYIRVRSGLGAAEPAALLLVPILYEDKAVAVLELASFRGFSGKERQLIGRVGADMGILINTLADVARIDELLRETQLQKEELESQTEELQVQAEELQLQTEELQAQTEELKAQTDQLHRQSLDLEASNEQLRLQAEELRGQTEQLEASNRSLLAQTELSERQKLEIQAQAEEILLAAQHKSEFLANVSHELRTPLNSLLILSQILAENRPGNLVGKQLEYIHTIYSSGKDLLQLIDEILDLAKLETGKMTPVIEPTELQDIAGRLYRMFEQQAQSKELAFDIRIAPDAPDSIDTDGHRAQQILRNLLSNALKFTDEGSVALSIRKGAAAADEVVFEVEDTGIGVPTAKLESIFEAFQQADGTTSRKYGGTGLGLTISRELAELLSGRIEAESTPGQGSRFRLVLPARQSEARAQAAAAAQATISIAEKAKAPAAAKFMESFVPDISISNPKLLQFSEMEDDRDRIEPGDAVLLIIEDDAAYAAILLKLARNRGFKALVAFQGDQGLALAHAYKPDAIVLDTDLPVLDGRSIISRLKSRPELRHIPVHVISTEDRDQQTLSLGALSFWKKPSGEDELATAFLEIDSYIRRKEKSLLIVEDNADLRHSLVAYIGHPDVRITAVGSGREALEQLMMQHFDCMVLDLGLSDISGFDLLEQVKTNRKLQTLPTIIYTGKELSRQDEQKLKQYAESIVIKNVRSMERLYDETALYLHRRTADLPPDKRQLIEKLHDPAAAFEGKRILIVDDDMRNIFALSSVLEGYNMDISFAQNGREAVRLLRETPDVELVFMDIMMPEMDGYETMRAIRSDPAFRTLAIIALTARAMEEDRIRCLDAGASDYMPKPINTTQLVTMLKTWLIN